MFDGFIDTSDVREMPFTDEEFEQYAVQPGDVLLNEGQSSELVGRSAIYNGPSGVYAYQNTLLRFRAGPYCEPLFARELFHHLWRDGVFERISKKTTSIAHLGVTRFANVRVRVPPLSVQQRLADLVRRIDLVAENFHALLASKRRLKNGLMEEMLNGRRQTRGGNDEGFRRVRLGDHIREVCDRNNGRFGADAVMGVVKNVGLRLMKDRVRSANLDRYQIVPPQGFAYNPMRLNIGSIARNTSGQQCLVSPDYVVFATEHNTLLPEYLDQVRRSQMWRRFVRPAGSGSVRVRIYLDDLARMRIPLPSIIEQKRITNTLETLDREIALLEQQRDAYKAQKRALMQRLLSGDIPDLDPAA